MSTPSTSGKVALRLRLPATSANLGPGFDAVAVALDFYLEVDASPGQEFSIIATGRDADRCARLEDNLILEAYKRLLMDHDRPVVPLSIRMSNGIPLGMGCGSSAAGRLAAIALAVHFGQLGWGTDRILEEAYALEGHPDNVAACVLGSIVASAVEPGGITRAVRLEMPPNFRIAVVVPNFALPTKEARAVLPDVYSRADATFNIQRAALLMAALATGDTSAFPCALDDRLHQTYRAQLIPGLSEILRLRAPGLLGCTLSGAGPGVLVFYERGYESVYDLVRQTFAMNGCTTEVISSGVAPAGYEFL